MKALVLGGAGFVGSELCSYPQDMGDEVTILEAFLFEEDALVTDEAGASSPCRLARGDVRNLADLLPVMEVADEVVNPAAISNDPASPSPSVDRRAS